MKNLLIILFLLPVFATAQISDVIKQHNVTGILQVPTVSTPDSSLNAANTAWVKRQLYGTGSGGSTWGSITGTLSNQTDLQNALNLKLNISDTSSMLFPKYFRHNGNALGALAVLGTTDANALQLITNGSNAVRILSTGEVLIGATTAIGGSGTTKFQVDVLSQAYFGGNVYIGAAPISTSDRLTVTGAARITGNARIGDLQILANGTASTTGEGISAGNTGSEMNFQVNPGGVKTSYDFRYWTGTTGTFGASANSMTDKIAINIGNGNAGNDSQRVNTLSFRYVLNNTASFANIRFRGIYFNPVLTSLTNTVNTFILQATGDSWFNGVSGSTCIGCDTNAVIASKFQVKGTVRLDNMLVGNTASPILVKDADSVTRQIPQSWARSPFYNLQTGTSYTVLATDASTIIGLSNTAARTITLAAANTYPAGTTIYFKDQAGTGATGNILINRSGSDTIDGATSYTINTNYGFIGLYTNGSNAWFVR